MEEAVYRMYEKGFVIVKSSPVLELYRGSYRCACRREASKLSESKLEGEVIVTRVTAHGLNVTSSPEVPLIGIVCGYTYSQDATGV